MSIYTLDNGVEYEVAECPLCELIAPRPRAQDGLLHCASCDMMWREPDELPQQPEAAARSLEFPHAA